MMVLVALAGAFFGLALAWNIYCNMVDADDAEIRQAEARREERRRKRQGEQNE